jgi:hypothetical protein
MIWVHVGQSGGGLLKGCGPRASVLPSIEKNVFEKIRGVYSAADLFIFIIRSMPNPRFGNYPMTCTCPQCTPPAGQPILPITRDPHTS